MLEISSSKSLANDSKRFVFWVEFIALDLPSPDYLSFIICELFYRIKNFITCILKE